MDCPLCARDSPVHDFSLVCCMARYVLVLPTRAMRAERLALWRKQIGSATTAQVEDEVKRRWQGARVKK